MALNPNSLTTLVQAKTFCKIPLTETTQDGLMELYVNYASDKMETETDRILKKQSGIVETQHGRGQNILLLRQYPVSQITQLKITDEVVNPAEYQITDDSNGILLKSRRFARGYNNLEITYDAGFDPIPSDLEMATLWLVFWQYKIRTADDIGRNSKSKDGESVSYMQSMPQEVRDTILKYRRMEFPNSNLSVFG